MNLSDDEDITGDEMLPATKQVFYFHMHGCTFIQHFHLKHSRHMFILLGVQARHEKWCDKLSSIVDQANALTDEEKFPPY